MKKLFTLALITTAASCFCQRTVEFTAMKYGLDSISQDTRVSFDTKTIVIEANAEIEILCTKDFDVNEFIVPIKGTKQFMKHYVVIRPRYTDFSLKNTRTFYRLVECCGPY